MLKWKSISWVVRVLIYIHFPCVLPFVFSLEASNISVPFDMLHDNLSSYLTKEREATKVAGPLITFSNCCVLHGLFLETCKEIRKSIRCNTRKRESQMRYILSIYWIIGTHLAMPKTIFYKTCTLKSSDIKVFISTDI